jgi:hypothetical protein
LKKYYFRIVLDAPLVETKFESTRKKRKYSAVSDSVITKNQIDLWQIEKINKKI